NKVTAHGARKSAREKSRITFDGGSSCQRQPLKNEIRSLSPSCEGAERMYSSTGLYLATIVAPDAQRSASAAARSAARCMLLLGGLFDREAIVDPIPVIIAVGEDLEAPRLASLAMEDCSHAVRDARHDDEGVEAD